MKKIKTLLLMLACVICFTACGNNEAKTIDYNEEQIKVQTDIIYNYISQEGIKEKIQNYPTYLGLNDDGLDYLSSDLFELGKQCGVHLKIEGKVFLKAIDSYNDNLELLGSRAQVKPTGEYDFDAKKDELIVTMYLTGPIHDGSIEFMYDKNLHITSVTTNVKYSLGESMKKAGINTAIGMGTVFVMLVVIMFIIMLLGLVPKLFNSDAKKKKADTSKAVDKTIEAIVEREEAESDDLELIAVISAAIAAAEGTSTDGFVVRSIKRIR